MINNTQTSAIIINIGDELLAGHTVNTNATWMSTELHHKGVKVLQHIVIADEKAAIEMALDLIPEGVDYVFITGGLGPTEDDRTKAVITQYFGGELVFSDEVYADVKAFFARRGRVPSESNRGQALIPNNAERLINTMGTASGMVFTKGNTKYFVMPGVPYEMKTMMSEQILPGIDYIGSNVEEEFQVNIFGLPESGIADRIAEAFPEELKQVKMGYYPSVNGITVRFSARNSILGKNLQAKITDMFKKHVYSLEGASVEQVFVELCINKKLKVSCAESCSGGRMSDMITSIPGSSAILDESYVTYSNEAKMRLLNVLQETLESFGAVSEATLKEMLVGLYERTHADVCLASSGIAGPGGGTAEKPVGLIYIGVMYADKIKIHKLIYDRGRERNKDYAARAALNLAREMISE